MLAKLKSPLEFYFGKTSAQIFFQYLSKMAALGKMSNALVKVSNDIMAAAVPKIKTFWYYGKVELTPPKLSDIPEIKNGISRIIKSYKCGDWKKLTVKQATLNTLVATECVLWFYIGEVIGKRHLIGYKLP